VAEFQCTDWQDKTATGGRITVYRVAELGEFDTELARYQKFIVREYLPGTIGSI
jgi:hypothetical protein